MFLLLYALAKGFVTFALLLVTWNTFSRSLFLFR